MTPQNHAAKLRYNISIILGLNTEDGKVIKCALIAVDEALDNDFDCNIWMGDLTQEEHLLEVKKILKNKL